jgi:hypothetical protein
MTVFCRRRRRHQAEQGCRGARRARRRTDKGQGRVIKGERPPERCCLDVVCEDPAGGRRGGAKAVCLLLPIGYKALLSLCRRRTCPTSNCAGPRRPMAGTSCPCRRTLRRRQGNESSFCGRRVGAARMGGGDDADAHAAFRRDGRSVTASRSTSRAPGVTGRRRGASRSRCGEWRAPPSHRIEHGHGHWVLYLVPRPGLTARVVLPFADLRAPAQLRPPRLFRFGGGPHPVDLATSARSRSPSTRSSPDDKALTLADFGLHDTVRRPAVRDPRVVVDTVGSGRERAPRSPKRRSGRPGRGAGGLRGFPAIPTPPARRPRRRSATAPASSASPVTAAVWLVVPTAAASSRRCDCVRPNRRAGGRPRNAVRRPDGRRATGTGGSGPWRSRLWADFHARNLRRRHGDDPGWHERWSATRRHGCGAGASTRSPTGATRRSPGVADALRHQHPVPRSLCAANCRTSRPGLSSGRS